MVYIEFFGDWNVYKDGIRVDEFKSKKALKILFYLILSERSRVSVEEIIRIFWAGYEKDYARKNLNVVLERGSKSYDEVIKGFLSRIKVNFDSIELLSEDETLRRLSSSAFGQSLTAN